MKFSVIVPVYNCESYIERCIDSVVKQNYDDWELILIDDGSTDQSLKTIMKWVKLDNRIHVYSQQNCGPGLARNNGMEKATGDYLIFIDADDYIDDDYMKLLNPLAEKNDVVFIDAIQVDQNFKEICTEKMSLYKDCAKDAFIRAQMTGKIRWAGWRKAVNIKLIRDHDIVYSNHGNGEESIYSFCLLWYAETYSFLNKKPVYYYVNRPGSQSKAIKEDPYAGVYEEFKKLLEIMGLYTTYANTLNSFSTVSALVSMNRIIQIYSGKEMNTAFLARYEAYRSIIDKDYVIDKESLDLKAKISLPFLRIGWLWPIKVFCYSRIFAKNLGRHSKIKRY